MGLDGGEEGQPAAEAAAGSPMQGQAQAQVHHRGSTVSMTTAMGLPHRQHPGRHYSHAGDSWEVGQACTWWRMHMSTPWA